MFGKAARDCTPEEVARDTWEQIKRHVNEPAETPNNGRRAANAVLHRAGSKEESAKTILPYRPPEWEPLKRVDEDRWQRGLPNLFDPG